MASHFSYFPSDNNVVTPYFAQYAYPSQSNQSTKMTPRIPPKNGSSFSPGQTIRFEIPAQGYTNPANTMMVMDVVLVAPTNPGAYTVRFQNNIQSIFNRVTLKYGGTPQEDMLQYGLLVRLLTESTSTGQNNNVNQMAISDGIGGSCTGSVLSAYNNDVTPSAVTTEVVDGKTLTTFTVPNPAGLTFKQGQFLRTTSITAGGYDVTDEVFQVVGVPTTTTVIVETPGLTGSMVLGGGAKIYPIQNAYGLLNTRQSQIQGHQIGFTSFGNTGGADDAWVNTVGFGSASVPNLNAPGTLPGGIPTPTRPYSVRRYMVSFALGLFTQDKLIPSKWMASQLAIEITLELAENCIYQPVGASTNTIDPTYMVGNVALIPEIILFDDSYDNNFLEALESGGVPIKFCTWHYYQFNTQGSSSLQLAITERSRSTKGLLAVQRRSRGGFQYDSHACIFDSSPSTKMTSKASSMKEFQYRIGGLYYPGQPVQLSFSGHGASNGGAEAYAEYAKFLNIVGDARLSTNIIPLNWAIPASTHSLVNILPEYDYSFSIVNYTTKGSPVYVRNESPFSAYCGNAPSCMFACAANFETSNGTEISGLNAEEQADISFNVSWTEAQSGDHQIEIFTYVDVMMVLKVFLFLMVAKQLCRSYCLIKYGSYNKWVIITVLMKTMSIKNFL